MFPYVLTLGFLVLIGIVLIARWYVSADTESILKVLKWLLIGTIFCVALFFVLSGRLGWAVMGLPILLPMIMRIRAVMRVYKAFSRMAGTRSKKSSENFSKVETETIQMFLDQETGEMWGKILKGPYKGQNVEDLARTDLLALMNYCWKEDQEAVQVLEAYLDRKKPGWRENAYYNDRKQSNGSLDAMSKDEALNVLGLEPGATDAQIKEAYHKLINSLHPDHGGSNYLAAKINQAKDTLLGS